MAEPHQASDDEISCAMAVQSVLGSEGASKFRTAEIRALVKNGYVTEGGQVMYLGNVLVIASKKGSDETVVTEKPWETRKKTLTTLWSCP